MRIETIDAAEARHRAEVFWVENSSYTYNEKIMNAINSAASVGRRSVKWNRLLPKSTQLWLLKLGYTIDTLEFNPNIDLYKYLISWEK